MGQTETDVITGAYDAEADTPFCIDGDCATIDVSDGGKKLKITYDDSSNGCKMTMKLSKA